MAVPETPIGYEDFWYDEETDLWIIPSDSILLHLPTGDWNITLSQLPRRHTNISFGTALDIVFMESLGYRYVKKVTPPAGDVVTEKFPEADEDGVYHQTYDVRIFTPEENAERLTNAQSMARSFSYSALLATLDKGYVHQVDTNITIRMPLYGNDFSIFVLINTAIGNGMYDGRQIRIRDMDGHSFSLEPTVAKAMIDSSHVHRIAVNHAYWDFLDQVDNATTAEAVPLVPPYFEI